MFPFPHSWTHCNKVFNPIPPNHWSPSLHPGKSHPWGKIQETRFSNLILLILTAFRSFLKYSFPFGFTLFFLLWVLPGFPISHCSFLLSLSLLFHFLPILEQAYLFSHSKPLPRRLVTYSFKKYLISVHLLKTLFQSTAVIVQSTPTCSFICWWILICISS